MTAVALVSVLADSGESAARCSWARAVPGAEADLGTPSTCRTAELLQGRRALRDGDGGLYWFLATALPGFRSFRYPGKLLLPAALVAGRPWRGWGSTGCRGPSADGPRPWPRRRLLAGLIGLSTWSAGRTLRSF